MTKRNNRSSPTKLDNTLTGKGTTPRRGDKSKQRRVRNEEEMTSTDQVPLDIEPDGIAGTEPTAQNNANRYSILDDDDISAATNPPRPRRHKKVAIDLLDITSDEDSDFDSVDTVELVKKIKKNHKNHNSEQPPPTAPVQFLEPPAPIREQPPRICKDHAPPPSLDNSGNQTPQDDDDSEEEYDPSIAPAQRDFPFPDTEAPLTNNELEKLLKDRDKDLQDVTRQLQFQPPTHDIPTETPGDVSTSPSPMLDDDTPTKASYAAAAASNPYKPFTPAPIDPDRTVRYGIRIDIPASAKPLTVLLKAIKTTFTLLQDSIDGQLGIGAWDHRTTSDTITTPQNIPNGSAGNKDKQFIQRYFDHWIKATPNKDYTAYMKIRFVTSNPSSLHFPLVQLGSNLSDDLLAECKDPKKDPKIFLYKNPLPCQAIKPVVVGWLFGSVKSIREDTFISAVRKELGIPLHVAFGVSWKTLKNEKKKQYAWDPTTKPPQALTIEIEEMYSSVYAPKMSNLWKKRNKSKICGLHLRLIPCFSSVQMAGADDELKTDSLAMAQKQQHFSEHYTIRLHNPFIAGLDIPIPDPLQPGRPWTLRRHLMKASPPGLPSQRLLVTADQAWNGDGFHLVTVHPHLAEATRLMSDMIPECLHLYGPHAAKWFNHAGLEAFQDSTWNPHDRRIVSQDRSMTACVREDFFGMGDKWKPAPPPQGRPLPAATAALNPTATATTAKEVIAQRLHDVQRSDQSIQSFGNRGYNREHDGDTVQTTASALHPDSLDDNTEGNDGLPHKVQIDLTGMELPRESNTNTDDGSTSISTMAQTTGSTRIKLKSVTKQNEALAAENEHQAAEMEAMENDRATLEARLAAMQKRMDAMETASTRPLKRVSLITPKDSNDYSAPMDVDSQPILSPTPFTRRPTPRVPITSATTGGQSTDTPVAGIGDPD